MASLSVVSDPATTSAAAAYLLRLPPALIQALSSNTGGSLAIEWSTAQDATVPPPRSQLRHAKAHRLTSRVDAHRKRPRAPSGRARSSSTMRTATRSGAWRHAEAAHWTGERRSLPAAHTTIAQWSQARVF